MHGAPFLLFINVVTSSPEKSPLSPNFHAFFLLPLILPSAIIQSIHPLGPLSGRHTVINLWNMERCSCQVPAWTNKSVAFLQQSQGPLTSLGQKILEIQPFLLDAQPPSVLSAILVQILSAQRTLPVSTLSFPWPLSNSSLGLCIHPVMVSNVCPSTL